MLGATAKIFATTTVLLASFTGLRADSHHEGPKTVGRDRGYGRLPLAFEPNQGQARADVRFISGRRLRRVGDYNRSHSGLR